MDCLRNELRESCSNEEYRHICTVIYQLNAGGAVVMWARHLYVAEAERQVSDTNFYQEQDRDFTTDNNNRDTIEEFATFMKDFHPSVKFTWSISDEKLPFLDLVLRPTSDRLTTSIHCKPTDTHSSLNYASWHPICC